MLTWTKLAAVKKGASPHDLSWIGGQLYGTGIRLEAWQWTDSGFASVVTKDDGERVLEGMWTEHVLAAWDGCLVGFGIDGRTFVLDVGAKQWQARSEPDTIFKLQFTSRGVPRHTSQGALAAFDPGRGLAVLWGPAKAAGRKDETYVHDGKNWTKAKRGTPFADADDESASGFALYYDPTEKAVVRVGKTSVGVFDGKAWTQFPLEGADVLDRWYPRPCVGRTAAWIIQPGIHHRDVIRVQRAGDRFTATRVGQLERPVETESNRICDLGVYDPQQERFLAFVDVKREQHLFAADFSTLA